MNVFKITAKNPNDIRWMAEDLRPPVLVQVDPERAVFSQFFGLRTFKPSTTAPNYSMWDQEHLDAKLVPNQSFPEIPAVIYEEQQGIWIAQHLASDANAWSNTTREAMMQLADKINHNLEKQGQCGKQRTPDREAARGTCRDPRRQALPHRAQDV